MKRSESVPLDEVQAEIVDVSNLVGNLRKKQVKRLNTSSMLGHIGKDGQPMTRIQILAKAQLGEVKEKNSSRDSN